MMAAEPEPGIDTEAVDVRYSSTVFRMTRSLPSKQQVQRDEAVPRKTVVFKSRFVRHAV
jgi:hypothetical protein